MKERERERNYPLGAEPPLGAGRTLRQMADIRFGAALLFFPYPRRLLGWFLRAHFYLRHRPLVERRAAAFAETSMTTYRERELRAITGNGLSVERILESEHPLLELEEMTIAAVVIQSHRVVAEHFTESARQLVEVLAIRATRPAR